MLEPWAAISERLRRNFTDPLQVIATVNVSAFSDHQRNAFFITIDTSSLGSQGTIPSLEGSYTVFSGNVQEGFQILGQAEGWRGSGASFR